MESNNYYFIPSQQRKSNHKAIVAAIAGLAILGAVVFVAFNAETELVNNQAFFSKYTLEEEEAFDSFLKTYKKQYLSASEHNSRLGVFVNNFRFIKAANEDEFLTYEVGVNQFADMTLEEFELAHLGVPSTESLTPDNSEVLTVTSEMVAAVPASVDFRPKLTGIKHQGGCGSCWTFSTVATLDFITNNMTGNITTYSEQELLDCSKPYGTYQCAGGWMKDALRYVIDNGITLGANYTYAGYVQTCRNSTTPRSLKISGQGTINKNDNDALLVAAASNVLAVTVHAGSQGWQFYSKGIINANCGLKTDHAVNIVGYGTDNSVNYWTIRNSWGVNWGDKGHTRILRETGLKPGVCGIAQTVNYPILIK